MYGGRSLSSLSPTCVSSVMSTAALLVARGWRRVSHFLWWVVRSPPLAPIMDAEARRAQGVAAAVVAAHPGAGARGGPVVDGVAVGRGREASRGCFGWHHRERFWRCRSVPGAAREGAQSRMSDQAQARCRPRSAAGTGWSFLVVVSCGRSTNDHLRVPECRTVSGFRGRAETATTYPQFISLDSAVRPSWAAAIAPALPTGAAGAPADAGTPGVLPRASGVAAVNASCSGSSQERPATSRLLISTESRVDVVALSHPQVPLPVRSGRRRLVRHVEVGARSKAKIVSYDCARRGCRWCRSRRWSMPTCSAARLARWLRVESVRRLGWRGRHRTRCRQTLVCRRLASCRDQWLNGRPRRQRR